MTSEEKQELCKKCRMCCKKIAFILPLHSDVIHFYKTRGWSTLTLLGRNQVEVWKYETCPHLTENGCDIYKDRPVACIIYDGRKDPLVAKDCLWGKE
jgi:Fe-S-cluster containining protein